MKSSIWIFEISSIKKIVVVGKKTKDVLMQYGIIADLMPEEAGEINLSELMKQEVDAKDVVWYCKGISGGEKLKKALTPICQVTEKACMKIIERF